MPTLHGPVVDHHSVGVFVGWGAAAQKLQGHVAGVGDLVSGAGRDRDRVAGADIADVVFYLHAGGACKQIINLLALGMEVWKRLPADGQACFSQALVHDTRITVSQQLADLGAIDRGESWYFGDVFDVHTPKLPTADSAGNGCQELRRTTNGWARQSD